MKKSLLLALFAILTLTLVYSFHNLSHPNNYMDQTPPEDYEAEWKVIDSLETQGLPKSALEKVEILYERAKQEQNAPQLVKTLLYKGKYVAQLEENGQIAAIQLLEKETGLAEFPAKPILESILAEVYQRYLSDQYWILADRQNTSGFQPEDIQTWTLEHFERKIGDLYWASLNHKDLKRLPIAGFEAVTIPGTDKDELRPTLYDFLAHRAIDHFMSEQSYLSQPAYRFYIDKEEAFGEADDFVKYKFETKDSTSRQYQTLLLLQDLLGFRLDDRKNDAALLDVDLKRLAFVYDKSVLDVKKEVYLKALDRLEEKHSKSPLVTEVLFLKANYYFQDGYIDEGKTDPKSGYWKIAHQICVDAMKRFPSSVGASQCNSLKRTLEEKVLRFNTETVNIPGQPFLAKVDFRNLTHVYGRVIRMNEKRKDQFEKSQEKGSENALKYLKELPVVKTFHQELPAGDDFHVHSGELKMDALPAGQYIVLVSSEKNFGMEGFTGYLYTHVSKLGYWEHREEGGQLSFVVFDRMSGEPLPEVTGELWRRNYNSLFRKYEWKKGATAKSDQRGFLRPDTGEKNDYYNLLLRKGTDTLYLEDGFSTYYYSLGRMRTEETYFFLDRAIYRPGQTVYFKALLMEKDESGKPHILPNQPMSVILRDVNYQEVAKLDLRTNAYGTVTATFKAPEGGLLGNMHLESNRGNSRQHFRVEEYKRPKFEVKFDELKEAYRLDDQVSVTGKALGFAGNNIDGATVSFRVVREVSYPWWWGWYRPSRPQGESMEIANGIGSTDALGEFSIVFKAQPDRSVDPKTQPQFTFRVYADVTDITGETHSGETFISLGYLALKASITIPDQMPLDSFQSVSLLTQNLQGQFEPAKGTLRMDLLRNPEQTFVERYWFAPDRQLIPEAEFRKAFPNYAFKEEDRQENWEVKKEVLETPFNTAESKTVPIPKAKLEPGVYLLTLETADKYGQKIEVKKWVTLFDPSGKKITTDAWGWVHLLKNTLEPGQKAEWLVQTQAKQIKVLFEVEREGKLLRSEWVDVKKVARIVHEIQESDRGNIHAHIHYAGMNRSFNQTQTIVVPWTNKQLKVELSTFRDKLLPGSEEEWRIKIKGPKGEKVAAEMVAAMYDASLDQFTPHDWYFQPYPVSSYASLNVRPMGYGAKSANYLFYPSFSWEEVLSRSYRSLNWFNFPFFRYEIMRSRMLSASPGGRDDAKNGGQMPAPKMEAMYDLDATAEPVMANGAVVDQAAPPPAPPDELEQSVDQNALNTSAAPPVKIRSDLDETVFFKPDLMTDEEGNIVLRFKMKEALTRWKLLGFAHTLSLESGILRQEVITQKDLMVLPNPPRFYRERDEIEFTAKVVNLSDKTLSGNAELQLLDPLTTTRVYKWLDNPQFNINFTVEAGQSARLAWRFKVPDVNDVSVIEHTVVAAAGDFEDAERAAAPVLSNRMLVTETMPLPVKGGQTRTFVLQSMAGNTSTTLANHRYTLEFTSNPAWYAVQALPYLMEYPYECTEQIFSRYYANSLATSVANSHPKIKEVFEKWKDTPAMESNLTKNQELKSALLQETPWVLQALSEEEQKRNIGLLFDLNRMAKEQASALDQIRERQLPNGGFSWFPGERDSWYITQYIVEGMAHLHKLGVTSVQNEQMVKNAVSYTDRRMEEWYRDLEKWIGKDKEQWEKDHLSPLVIHYLYARSFFLEEGPIRIPLDGKITEVHAFCMKQAAKYWLNKGIYQEGMLALALNRSGDATTATSIMRSLKERSLNHEELGMYWKFNRGYFWYEHPIETQSLLIEAFDEVAKDPASVESMKIWLLKNKQTNHWKTTKATAAAVYALLRSGDNWLLSEEQVKITMGVHADKKTAIWNKVIGQAQQKSEAGTGYFKVSFDGEQVNSEMATVTIQNPNKTISWGGVYWQYFEDLDRIKGFEETPLTLKRQLFKAELSPTGEKIRPVAEGEALHPGDKLVVRIELRVDRPMEYIHLKDMRASGFEPIQVLSQYKWQGGLGYYESPRDASTNFFISYLPQGTHIFEYPLRVVHKGDFSTGITTIQCMYAPEFSSHSSGIRVVVD
ncbi:MAG: hypothetical protein IPJ00_13930 [Saprospirales bacterium]|nr:hypothetical protein [Saprospirales bacterium]